jgi:uncharacterized protein YbgA (DUF1722 family)
MNPKMNDKLPSKDLALMVGVVPQTIRRKRREGLSDQDIIDYFNRTKKLDIEIPPEEIYDNAPIDALFSKWNITRDQLTKYQEFRKEQPLYFIITQWLIDKKDDPMDYDDE